MQQAIQKTPRKRVQSEYKLELDDMHYRGAIVGRRCETPDLVVNASGALAERTVEYSATNF